MKTTTLILTIAIALRFASVNAQTPPPIQWQKCLGGTGPDEYGISHKTTDGGYITIGGTASIDGDVTDRTDPTHEDVWVVKTNSSGTIDWEKSYGGNNQDYGVAIQQTTDGGYIFVANTESSDLTNFHGQHDYWIVKIDAYGIVTWQKCMGGTNDDNPYTIKQTSDGGYLVAGTSASSSGQVTGNHGGVDAWIAKLSSTGGTQWKKCYGGTNSDGAYDFVELPDGSIIFSGYTRSTDGDITVNYNNGSGNSDAWLVKISGVNGDLIWSNCYGGSYSDAIQSLQLSSEGNGIVIATGLTTSNDGLVAGNHGGLDFLVLKADGNGNFIWAKCFGGTEQDEAASISVTSDQGYLITGETYSNDGDVTNNYSYQNGTEDVWVIKLNIDGTLLWQKNYGGTGYDYPYSGEETPDGGFIISGETVSNDFDVSGFHGGGFDIWLVKLQFPCLPPQTINCIVSASPPACGITTTFSVGGAAGYTYQWKRNGFYIVGATNQTYTTNKKYISCDVSNSCATTPSPNSFDNIAQTATVTPSGTVNKCAGEFVNFSANTGLGLTYQWYKGRTAIAGATNSTYSTNKKGTFKVTVYNTETLCSKTSSKTTVNNVCREQENSTVPEIQLTAFPNPANDEMQIDISCVENISISLQVYDVMGKLMKTFSSEDIVNGSFVLLNTSLFNGGMYFCNVTSDSDHRVLKSIKFIVQH